MKVKYVSRTICSFDYIRSSLVEEFLEKEKRKPSLKENESITEITRELCENREWLMIHEARVSSSNPNNKDIKGLLSHCLNKGHWSVFEMIDVTWKIETTRMIAQQILRHRSFSFQERSLRYAKAQDYESYGPRSQSKNNRQSSIDNMVDEVKEWWEETQSDIFYESMDKYRKALDLGISKECARSILPLNTKTTLFMKGSIRSWIHYLNVRTKEDAQLEHREIAEEIKKQFCDYFPVTSKALGWLESDA